MADRCIDCFEARRASVSRSSSSSESSSGSPSMGSSATSRRSAISSICGSNVCTSSRRRWIQDAETSRHRASIVSETSLRSARDEYVPMPSPTAPCAAPRRQDEYSVRKPRVRPKPPTSGQYMGRPSSCALRRSDWFGSSSSPPTGLFGSSSSPPPSPPPHRARRANSPRVDDDVLRAINSNRDYRGGAPRGACEAHDGGAPRGAREAHDRLVLERRVLVDDAGYPEDDALVLELDRLIRAADAAE
mmetsp:Transcript_10194/g.35880  ORF Transcript_10194/g.35880 Transcript_10194/m.35880 type:complete len:246 (-) Transcript_10194:20-757(-)